MVPVRKSISRAKRALPKPIEDKLDFGRKTTESFAAEFRNFAVKGNALDLAVGIVIGAAFTSIVNSLVKDIITPIIELLTGNVNLEDKFFVFSSREYSTLAAAQEAGENVLRYGLFIDSIINFLIVSLALFIVIKFILRQKKKEEKKEKIKMKQCPFCLEDVKEEASKCKYCASKLE